MSSSFVAFEAFARLAHKLDRREPDSVDPHVHPLIKRDVHPLLLVLCQRLFDNGHYAQATFEAFKYVDREVQRLSGLGLTGSALMHQAFNVKRPSIQFTPCQTETEQNVQQGLLFLFAGAILAIRNPRGHEYSVQDTVDDCIEHLVLASMLLRRLEDANCILSATQPA